MNKGDAVNIRVGDKIIRGTILNPECRASHGPKKGEIIPNLSSMTADDTGSKYWVTLENRI